MLRPGELDRRNTSNMAKSTHVVDESPSPGAGRKKAKAAETVDTKPAEAKHVEAKAGETKHARATKGPEPAPGVSAPPVPQPPGSGA